MLTYLYQIIISPIKLLIEVIFVFCNGLFGNAGFAVIAVSITVNFLVLPMYRQADAIQEAEREKQKEMAPWLAHIRKTFRGDERFMMQSAYYRICNYKPIYALRGSLSLLLQIPFFIAAYSFLSSLDALKGVSFLGIQDLSRPDALLQAGPYALNLLPVLMTIINIISGAIYLKGAPLKEKAQLYIMALLFLVLLYSSPAGLVLYWTCNNLFSLFKNIFQRVLPHAEVIGSLLLFTVGLLLAGRIYYKTARNFSLTYLSVILLILLATAYPLFLQLQRHVFRVPARREAQNTYVRTPMSVAQCRRLFLLGCILLTLMTGLVIPASVLAASPGDFINMNQYVNPIMAYVPYTLCIAVGFFLLWAQILYYFTAEATQRVIGIFTPACAIAAMVNYLFFGNKYGLISSELVYDETLVITWQTIVINLFVNAAVVVLFVLLCAYFSDLSRTLTVAIVISAFSFGAYQIYSISSTLTNVDELVVSEENQLQEGQPLWTLSKTKQNVVVIMLDRAVGKLVPYIFAEKPALRAQFDGFTYYPNTISYGHNSIYGIPGLYGGYDYTPAAMADRPDDLLSVKTNEALMTMPLLFREAGFAVTVCDQPMGNYSWTTDLSIYNEYPDINAHITQGAFPVREISDMKDDVLKRNFFCYGVFRCAPVALHSIIYDRGDYRNSANTQQELTDVFKRTYSAIERMVEFTATGEDAKGAFVIFDNETTHSPVALQLPDYTLTGRIDNSSFNTTFRMDDEGNRIDFTNGIKPFKHYCSAMVSFLRIGEWLDYLREEGVYDNTRIIIVSDHGHGIGVTQEVSLSKTFNGVEIVPGWITDVSAYNPVLLIKDFGSSGFRTDNTFMTNADVPSIATENIIEEPKNPFTGNPISTDRKEGPQFITFAHRFKPKDNPGTTFNTEGYPWYAVHDNLFVQENWTEIEDPTK